MSKVFKLNNPTEGYLVKTENKEIRTRFFISGKSFSKEAALSSSFDDENYISLHPNMKKQDSLSKLLLHALAD
jgi:hypothetical protein